MAGGPWSDTLLVRVQEQLGDRYQFLTLLGQGGGGSVFEVRNLTLGRIEALKVLGEDLGEFGAERFAHEAKISASLDHPRIVKVYAFGDAGGLHWYSMQQVDGPSLGMLIEGGMTFDEGMAAGLAAPMLDALAYSHARGVVHRDIKPANILINPEGRPFLSDFGIAKTSENLLKTRTGQMLGTPAYVAPEQALGEAVDARADQYSLGITLYRMLAGRLPFTADSMLQTIVLRLKEPPEPLLAHRPGMDPGVAAVIMRALARDRDQRWPDVQAMRVALLSACEASGIPWTTPLSGHLRFQAPRRALGPATLAEGPGGTVPLARKSYDPTASLVHAHRRWPPRRLALGALSALLAGGGALLGIRAWKAPPAAALPGPVPPVEGAASAKESPPGGTPGGPVPPAERPPAEPRPAPAAALPRRPVSYPQLEEAQPPFAARAGCAGLRASVSLRISTEGRVLSCRVLTAVSTDCATAVRDMALALRFRPALDAQGQPVETSIATAITLPEAP